MLPIGWVSKMSKKRQATYYFHAASNTTTWDLPTKLTTEPDGFPTSVGGAASTAAAPTRGASFDLPDGWDEARTPGRCGLVGVKRGGASGATVALKPTPASSC